MEEKDFIETILAGRTAELELADPPLGHADRFRARLENAEHHRIFTMKNGWRIAAAVVFIFLAVNQARIWMMPEEKGQTSLGTLSPEYSEVEYYYTNAISKGVETLNSLTGTGVITKGEYEIMETEFVEFEKRYQELQKELEANPGDERIINAMIGYYQAKLDVINMIVNKLQEVKQKRSESHEIEI